MIILADKESMRSPSKESVFLSSSSSSHICHGVGPLFDPFRSHVSRSLFKVYHDSFCQLGSSVSLPWVIYFEAIYLHVVSNFACIPVICPELVLFLNLLQLCILHVCFCTYMGIVLRGSESWPITPTRKVI